MEWNDEQSLKLKQLYKDHPILWDPTCSQYKLGKKKIEYWREIATELNTNAVEAKKKMDSLLASYRRERNREVKPSGAGSDKIYHSNGLHFNRCNF